MPNWCENKLIVKSNGYESEFLKFMEQGRNTEIIKGKKVKVWRISNYMPTPERLLEENLSENEKKEVAIQLSKVRRDINILLMYGNQ